MFGLRMGLTAAVVGATVAPTLGFEISSSSVSDGKWDQKYLADKIAGCDGQNVSPAVACPASSGAVSSPVPSPPAAVDLTYVEPLMSFTS